MDEQQLEQLQAALKASEEALKVTVKKQAEEIKTHGETTVKTAKSVEAAEKRLDQVIADLKGLSEKTIETLTAELKEAKSRIDEMEKRGQRPGWDQGAPEAKSPGELFLESEALKLCKSAGKATTDPVGLKSLFEYMEQKSTFLSDAATRLVVPQRIAPLAAVERQLRVRDLIPVRPTTSNAIEYLEETGFATTGAATGTQTHGAAAPIGEAQASPEAQLEMVLQTASVRNISHWLPASRQVLDDVSQLRTYIDDRLVYGVKYREELQFIYGTGTAPNLQGIATHTGNQDYAWSTGTDGDTKIDAIRRAATKAHVREYMPSGVIVNPNDWEDIELAKGTDGHYLWFRVASGTEERLFRLPVVVTNAINAGDALVGAFGMGATIWDRQQASVRVAEQHGDFFVQGQVAILAEERLALAIYRPDAFVLVDFDSAPAA